MTLAANMAAAAAERKKKIKVEQDREAEVAAAKVDLVINDLGSNPLSS